MVIWVGVPGNKEPEVALVLLEMLGDGRLGFGSSGDNIGVCGGSFVCGSDEWLLFVGAM